MHTDTDNLRVANTTGASVLNSVDNLGTVNELTFIAVNFFVENITDELTESGGFDAPVLSGGHSIFIDLGDIYAARVRYQF